MSSAAPRPALLTSARAATTPPPVRDGADRPTAERSLTAQTEAADDAALVRRFTAGDETAFVEIMGRHRDKIFGLTLALLRNRGDAEEITQDTFIRAHRGLGKFRGDCSLATWLHRIAVNLARNRYWYFFRRRRHATLSLDCALADDSDATFTDLVASDAPDPARATTNGEFAALVAACMESLDPRHREILTLRTLLHRPYQEIAATLGLNVGTVKSRIARARENLRTQLAERCPEFATDDEPSSWFEPSRSRGRLAPACA
jgi:RNA polymerase sigma-70 factor (ECF subfamily)